MHSIRFKQNAIKECKSDVYVSHMYMSVRHLCIYSKIRGYSLEKEIKK